ncbi:unnamed protein product [Calicophoron daubneyi]|uniref:GPR158/179 extracellular domain-containing protein n=1 Tax=Calicophoron daubneyi TaxID=300641 RepID=A0AAV2U0R1_CALDB
MGLSANFISWLTVLLVIIPVALLQDGSNPFRWFPEDNFDIISRKMNQANPENCVTMSESDLRLPPTSLSQLPQYNRILLQQWFTNRSKLLHLHNLALNRAFFYSYIQQRLDGPVIDVPFLPSLLYYYFSAAADVSSGPNVMNASAVLMDTNTTYANWYGLKVINRTLPLFGPMALRLDNWNDELNFLRVPTNNTIKIHDMGAGPNCNYTAPWYKNNPYILDREMGISFIPDRRGTAPSKNQYSTKIQLATITGEAIQELEVFKFYGPNAPGIKETFLPVRFTRPYYDCGASNRWIVSSVSALSDYMPRYSNITRLRGPRMVGIIVQSMDFYRIDFNPCPPGLGNPNHYLAGIARCKPTTLCVPLPGFGFRRGGYQCVCQPGHRLPPDQDGPFRGVDIEIATEDEYNAGFNCIPVEWREVIPEETGMIEDLSRRGRSAGFFDLGGDYIPGGQSAWRTFKRYTRNALASVTSMFGFYNTGSPTDLVHASNGVRMRSRIRRHAIAAENYSTGTVIAKSTSSVPNYQTEAVDWNVSTSDPEQATSVDKQYSEPALHGRENQSELKELSRKKRNSDPPFYSVGAGGAVFDPERFTQMYRLIAHAKEVTSQNCHQMTADQLVFPGEVSYGAEVQFEMPARTALRLAHFLSAYYQNNIRGEVYGSLITDFPLNRYEMFGEVISNVMSNFDIVSSGIFFDYQMFTDHDGVTWDLFAPYAYKPIGSTEAAEAIDMSINYYRDYTEKAWFRTLKASPYTVSDRWVSSRYGLDRIITKPFIRSDVNGTQLQRYFNFPLYYWVPRYEDGYWTQPYFDCEGKVKEWLITYAAPFFGLIGEEQALQFMGVVTISVKLLSLDINQCPQSFYTPNYFKNTAKCDFGSTYCKPIPRRYFVAGSYKCECRQGFEYPFNDRTWYFHGELMEREYMMKLAGEPNRFDLLRCREALAVHLLPMNTWYFAIVVVLLNYWNALSV